MIAAALSLAIAIPAESVNTTFRFVPTKEVRSVYLAGSFNNWNPTATPMTERDGEWTVSIRLNPGRHLYKFVMNGNEWVLDPRASSLPDGDNNRNSVILVLPIDYMGAASTKDGILAKSALRHRTYAPDVNWDRGKLHFRFRQRPGDAEAQLILNGRPVQGERIAQDEFFETIQFSVSWDRKSDLRYFFQLTDGSKTHQFGPNGIENRSANVFRLKADEFKPYQVPTWVERTVLYQIFPDRFDNGNPANDPEGVRPWDSGPSFTNRFGGDIAGVRRRIGHLKDLGVGTVYFNPVFASPSNHRYDATDFLKIDPQFGTNEEWNELTKELQANGMRTVMDFVFNHTATDFKPFADILKNQKESKFLDWFYVKGFPVRQERNPNYEAWYGHASMPKLNLRNPDAYAYLMGAADYWIDNSTIAGFRLDVAEQVEPWFWQDLRKKLKAERKDFWICGEIWTDGSDWLRGDQFDSVMNYPFRAAVLRYLGEDKSSATEFKNDLTNLYAQYAPQVSRNLMNLLSSHDTPRFLTLAGNDPVRQKLAATVQFTWVGAPSVYYGEELGMQGQGDPDNRRGMRWDLATPDNSMLSHYRKLAKIRNESRALQSGDPVWLHADDQSDTVAFARVLGGEVAIIAVNRSKDQRTIKLDLRNPKVRGASNKLFVDALNGIKVSRSTGALDFTLEPRSAAVLLPASGSSSPVRGVSVSARPSNLPSVSFTGESNP